MKRCIAVVMTAVMSFLLLTTTTGDVEDKQAPGYPGHKTFQVKVGGSSRIVTEQMWDQCDLGDWFPLCVFSPAEDKGANI